MDMKLEVVVIPVADVDRAKSFYGKLGWRLDADFVVSEAFRAVQFTPPGSPCSIHFGKGITSAAPGSARGLFLVVSDIVAARADLVARGAVVGEVFHRLPGSDAPQLRLVRDVQRPGRQRVALAGGHRSIARTGGCGAHDLHLARRANRRVAPCRDRAWRV
jgi:catechol 2,3-dioxygenase-like lactoylglutathione lyase family enzyme